MKKILNEDLLLLDMRLKELDEQLFALGEEFNEAVNQSSETWHDNAPFDVARDKQTLLQYEKTQLLGIRKTVVIQVPKKSTKIDIGKKVELRSDSLMRLFIAGVWTSREEVDGYRVVTALSPIAAALIGKKVGDQIELPKGKYTVTSVD